MTQEAGIGYAYSYDAENHLTQASGMSGGPWNYVYDGNGLRVEKSNSPTNGTLYWRSITGDTIAESKLSGTVTNEYVFFARRRIAQNTNGTTYFYYTDQIGSTTVMTNGSGNPCYQATFTPCGEEHATQTTCQQNYKFTGHERDAETGLDYAFARYYDSRLGRFLSPDPVGGDANNPQSLNRYAYVANNPTNFVDLSGQNMKVPPINTGASWDEFDVMIAVGTLTEETDLYFDLGYSYSSLSGVGSVTDYIYFGTTYTTTTLYESLAFLQGGGAVGGGGALSVPLTPKNVKLLFYLQYGGRFNNCIREVFGADSGDIPQQTLANAPALNVSYTQQQLTMMAGGPAVGWNAPSLGAHGTVYEASDTIFHASGPNTLNAIFGTFAHETGNILDERMNPPGTTNGQPYGKTYGDPNDPQDQDTGAQVEECIFGSLQYPNGP